MLVAAHRSFGPGCELCLKHALSYHAAMQRTYQRTANLLLHDVFVSH